MGVFVVGIMAAYTFAYIASAKTVVLTIEEKGSVVVSDGNNNSQNQYRVYTDKGVYVVEDTIVFFNFRAADRYAQLKIGKTYSCKQAGWRVGLFSWFPNLVECKPK